MQGTGLTEQVNSFSRSTCSRGESILSVAYLSLCVSLSVSVSLSSPLSFCMCVSLSLFSLRLTSRLSSSSISSSLHRSHARGRKKRRQRKNKSRKAASLADIILSRRRCAPRYEVARRDERRLSFESTLVESSCSGARGRPRAVLTAGTTLPSKETGRPGGALASEVAPIGRDTRCGISRQAFRPPPETTDVLVWLLPCIRAYMSISQTCRFR